MQMLRTLRVDVDIGLHCGMDYPRIGIPSGRSLITPDNVVEFMGRFLLFPRSLLQSELARYLGMPAQAITYKLGERAWLQGRSARWKLLRNMESALISRYSTPERWTWAPWGSQTWLPNSGGPVARGVDAGGVVVRAHSTAAHEFGAVSAGAPAE